MMRSILLAITLLSIGGSALAAYDAQPRDHSTLQGSWRANPAASDDVDQLIAKLLEKEEQEQRQWRRRMQEVDPFALPDSPPTRDAGYRSRRENELRAMLGVSQTLEVTQDGADIEMASDLGTRRFKAGSTSQVSMRSGDLADARVGWDGEWFVIDRKVPGRLRQIEKLRRVKKTGQLEYVTKWSGDTELSGVKLRRIFDPVVIDAKSEDPALGPLP